MIYNGPNLNTKNKSDLFRNQIKKIVSEGVTKQSLYDLCIISSRVTSQGVPGGILWTDMGNIIEEEMK
jgi:hypothetical protein